MHRAAISLAQSHVRRFCSDDCGERDRNRRASRRKTEPVATPIKRAGGNRWAIQSLRKIYRSISL